jgi:hypothetical protein
MVKRGKNTSKRRSKLRVYIYLITSVYLLLSLFGITASNLSLNFSGELPNSAKVVFGNNQPIRSDEWLRGTPYAMGRHSNPFVITNISPLSVDYPDKIEEKVSFYIKSFVKPENFLFSLIPGDFGFALELNFAIFVFMLICPILLSRIFSIEFNLSVLFSAMVLFSPPVIWWSFGPLDILWPILLLLLVFSSHPLMHRSEKKSLKNRKSAAVIERLTWGSEFNLQSCIRISVAALLIARIPLMYQPWSFPTAILFGALGFGFLLNKEKQIKRIVAIEVLIAGVIGFLLYLTIFLTSYEAWKTLIQTSYPGGRRSLSGYSSVPLFSGPFDFILRESQYSSILQGTNQSEAALSPLILGFFVITLLALAQTRIRELAHLRPYYPLLALLLYMGAWVAVPGLEENFIFKPMTIFPSERIAQIGGVIATILFLIVANSSRSFLSTYKKYVLPLVFVITFLSTFLGGNNLKRNGIALESSNILLVSFVFTLCITLIFHSIDNARSYLPLFMFLVISSVGAFPITQGQGDLKYSAASRIIQQTASMSPHDYWASDGMHTDALLAAQGVKHLSGQLGFGPDKSKWTVLDPKNQWYGSWNRGASYVYFNWNILNTFEIRSPSADTVVIDVDPCDAKLDELGLKFLVSYRELVSPCLKSIDKSNWNGTNVFFYSRNNI